MSKTRDSRKERLPDCHLHQLLPPRTRQTTKTLPSASWTTLCTIEILSLCFSIASNMPFARSSWLAFLKTLSWSILPCLLKFFRDASHCPRGWCVSKHPCCSRKTVECRVNCWTWHSSCTRSRVLSRRTKARAFPRSFIFYRHDTRNRPDPGLRISVWPRMRHCTQRTRFDLVK